MHMCNIVLTDAQAWECANKLGLIGPAMEQPQYNMFEREKVIPSPLSLSHDTTCHDTTILYVILISQMT